MRAPRVKATLIYYSKVQVLHREVDEVAVAELKVWKVPSSVHYLEGRKFSMYLVWKESGEVIVGFDNHKPKGPHLHKGAQEEPYDYQGDFKLIEDFWILTRKAGFLV